MVAPSIPLDTCMTCMEGAAEHQSWHPTRGALLDIGHDMTKRWRERERWCVRQMADDELVGYGTRLRRQIAMAAHDGIPDFLVELLKEWQEDAESEYRWRQKAARLGAGTVARSGASWADRVDVVKGQTDLLLLIGFECGEMRTRTLTTFSCRCPFHDDRSPSLDIDTAKGVWLCRACSIGGDAITYVELTRNVKFPAAVTYLEDRLGIKPPERQIRGVQIVRADGSR